MQKKIKILSSVGNRLATPTRPNKFTQNGNGVCGCLVWHVCLTNFELARPKRTGPDPQPDPSQIPASLRLRLQFLSCNFNLWQLRLGRGRERGRRSARVGAKIENCDGDTTLDKNKRTTQYSQILPVLTDTHSKPKHEHHHSLLMLTSWRCGTRPRKNSTLGQKSKLGMLLAGNWLEKWEISHKNG